MTLDTLFPPPFEVQQRGWECAIVLVSDYADRLSLEELLWCRALGLYAPEALHWRDIGEALRLHLAVAGQRV